MSRDMSQDSTYRDHRPGDHGRLGGEMQSRVAAVADVELPIEVELDEAGACAVGRWQAGVLHESCEVCLSNSVLAYLPGRLGNRLGATGHAMSHVELGG